MPHSFHHLANKDVYDLCAANWPVYTQTEKLEHAPAWPTPLLHPSAKDKLKNQWLIRDVDASVLDNFSTQLGKGHYGLCVNQQNGKFSAYAAVQKSVLHKPREENLRDYRLGPDVNGSLQQISIALLPKERAETGIESFVPTSRASLVEKSQKLLGRISSVFTFGGSRNEPEDEEPVKRSTAVGKSEKLLMDTARNIKAKIQKRRLVLVWPGMHISTGGRRVIVTEVALDHIEADIQKQCGFATKQTSVLPSLDDPGEFAKVQVCPFLDTIPQTYDIDLFEDALSPYFAKNPLGTFAQGDTFKFNTVEFKIVSTDPPSLPRRVPLDRVIGLTTDELRSIVPPNTKKQRVGPSTAVCLGYPILPHWIDILNPENQHIVMSLPTPFESIMLLSFVSESSPSEIERVMNATEAMRGKVISPAKKARDLADAMQQLKIDVTDTMREDGLCTVCLDQFTPEDEVIKLDCSHVFHLKCLSNWLVRTKTCPLCKAAVTEVDLAASKMEKEDSAAASLAQGENPTNCSP